MGTELRAAAECSRALAAAVAASERATDGAYRMSDSSPTDLIVPSDLTDAQRSALAIVDTVNARDFSGWFLRSSVMSIIQVESAFHASAFRYEPAIDDASYGLMQLLSRTARDLGYDGPVYPDAPSYPGGLYDPTLNIQYGMIFLWRGWRQLVTAFGSNGDVTLTKWFSGYNEGYGAASRGRPDPVYAERALAAFDRWVIRLDETDRARDLKR
jgi:Transglycosylase SLT domain